MLLVASIIKLREHKITLIILLSNELIDRSSLVVRTIITPSSHKISRIRLSLFEYICFEFKKTSPYIPTTVSFVFFSILIIELRGIYDQNSIYGTNYSNSWETDTLNIVFMLRLGLSITNIQTGFPNSSFQLIDLTYDIIVYGKLLKSGS